MTPGASPGANPERDMQMKSKPAVFAADKVTADMLTLALKAMGVGAAVALLSALVVAAVVALLS